MVAHGGRLVKKERGVFHRAMYRSLRDRESRKRAIAPVEIKEPHPILTKSLNRHGLCGTEWKEEQEKFAARTDNLNICHATLPPNKGCRLCMPPPQRTSASYAPDAIRTDHGGAFIHTQSSVCTHPFDTLCARLYTARKVWRPRTLWHNGKAERSCRD